MTQHLPLNEALEVLKRDPTRPVRARVDELTVELRAVGESAKRKQTVGDLLRDLGPWEGESGDELDALFPRQPGNRRVPDLP